ncbi:uncharacterized protein V6R79_003575 [Siganus canaliculatus]
MTLSYLVFCGRCFSQQSCIMINSAKMAPHGELFESFGLEPSETLSQVDEMPSFHTTVERSTGRYQQGEKEQSSEDAGTQLSTYAIQMQKLPCCDMAVPDQVHLYLFRLNVEEVLSDSSECEPSKQTEQTKQHEKNTNNITTFFQKIPKMDFCSSSRTKRRRVKAKVAEPLLKPPEGAVFPLTIMQDVQNMNEKLCDTEFMSGVVAMVGEIGGSSLDDAVRRMMAFIMSHELSLQFNLFGRHGKVKFRDLRLFDVVYAWLHLKKEGLDSQRHHGCSTSVGVAQRCVRAHCHQKRRPQLLEIGKLENWKKHYPDCVVHSAEGNSHRVPPSLTSIQSLHSLKAATDLSASQSLITMSFSWIFDFLTNTLQTAQTDSHTSYTPDRCSPTWREPAL